jgi:hypothetical protein
MSDLGSTFVESSVCIMSNKENPKATFYIATFRDNSLFRRLMMEASYCNLGQWTGKFLVIASWLWLSWSVVRNVNKFMTFVAVLSQLMCSISLCYDLTFLRGKLSVPNFTSGDFNRFITLVDDLQQTMHSNHSLSIEFMMRCRPRDRYIKM